MTPGREGRWAGEQTRSPMGRFGDDVRPDLKGKGQTMMVCAGEGHADLHNRKRNIPSAGRRTGRRD